MWISNYTAGNEITATTITDNAADVGGGLSMACPNYGEKTFLDDSIAAGNRAASGADCASDAQSPSPPSFELQP